MIYIVVSPFDQNGGKSNMRMNVLKFWTQFRVIIAWQQADEKPSASNQLKDGFLISAA